MGSESLNYSSGQAVINLFAVGAHQMSFIILLMIELGDRFND